MRPRPVPVLVESFAKAAFCTSLVWLGAGNAPARAQSTPSINAGGIVNAAGYTAPVAPGTIVAVYGSFPVGASSGAPGLPLPTSLVGLSIQIGGIHAPLIYVSVEQVNLQIPWELAGQSQASITASLNGQTSAPETVQLGSSSPGIFTMNAQGSGQGAVLDANYRLVDNSNPAVPGVTALQIFCTGLGLVSNQQPSGSPASTLAETSTTPTVTVGGVAAKVLFSGLAPGYVGLYQVNAVVPADAPAGTAIPVVISMNGAASNTATIAVETSGNTGSGRSPSPTKTPEISICYLM